MLLAIVAHRTKGRLRLRFPGIKGNRKLAEEVKASILKLPGVKQVEVNPLTGSVLILHKNPDNVPFVMLVARHGEERQLFLLEVPAATPAAAGEMAVERTALRDLAGHSLLALGVAGVLLPVIPGTPFLLAGAAVLGPGHPFVARVSRWLRLIR